MLICFLVSKTGADDQFSRVTPDAHLGYIIPAGALQKIKVYPPDLGKDAVGFWTPSSKDVEVAEKSARQAINLATHNPAKAFPLIAKNPNGFAVPSLDSLRNGAWYIDKNYESYIRQFVGLILVDGKKQIYCNYFLPERVNQNTPQWVIDESDPSKHFIQTDDGGAGYWQLVYDLRSKKVASLSINSSP